MGPDMSGTQIEPTTPLLVTLPARQWNSLIGLANEGLGALAALLNEVQRQCVQASAPQSEPKAEHIPAPRQHAAPRPNGEATP